MQTATIIKPTELISIELFVDHRGVEVKDAAIAVVKIEGYPDEVTFTVKSRRSYEGEFEITALIRNNGSIFNLDQLKEAGIEYNFNSVKEAHKNLYETAERRYLVVQKENRKKTYDLHPIVRLNQIFATNKDYETWLPFLGFTSKEDYVENNAGLHCLYIDRPYDKNHRFTATLEYSHSNIKLDHNFKHITFKSAQSAIRKMNVL